VSDKTGACARVHAFTKARGITQAAVTETAVTETAVTETAIAETAVTKACAVTCAEPRESRAGYILAARLFGGQNSDFGPHQSSHRLFEG
jgi:hypothetical protein